MVVFIGSLAFNEKNVEEKVNIAIDESSIIGYTEGQNNEANDELNLEEIKAEKNNKEEKLTDTSCNVSQNEEKKIYEDLGNEQANNSVNIIIKDDEKIEDRIENKIENEIEDKVEVEIEDKVDLELDTDEDGAEDYIEDYFGTDKEKSDTDGDGLSDFIELYSLVLQPLNIDTDGDGIDNKTEIEIGSLIDEYINMHSLGKGLGANFPVVDRVSNKALVSTKSIDLDAKSYQNPSKLNSMLKKYGNDLINF